MCQDSGSEKIMCECCECDPCDCDGVNDEFRFLGTDGTTKTPEKYHVVST